MSYLGQQLGQGQAERFVYTATGGETSVTTDDAGRGIAYTVGQVDVYLNGAKLINGSDFTATTGTSITGLVALTAADVLEVFALSIFQASDTVSASVGGTFNGNVTVDADLSVTGTTTITTADINGGTIDGTTIATSDVTVGSGKTLDVSAGTLTLANDQISGDSIEGGTIGSVTITSLTATSADINGGTVDGANVGATTPGTGDFTTLTENDTAVVIQTDIGTDPNQIPLNQYLGTMAYQDLDNLGNISPDGIYLGGTTSANLLDDYEQGTWTPAYSASSGSATYTIQSGTYIKIGNTVFCIGLIATSASTLAGSILRITGQPFTSNDDERCVIARRTGWTTAAPSGGNNSGSNSVNLRASSTANNDINLDPANLGASTLYFFLSYTTA